jgi:hypothetical protein
MVNGKWLILVNHAIPVILFPYGGSACLLIGRFLLICPRVLDSSCHWQAIRLFETFRV